MPQQSTFTRVALAGFAATAIAFGPGRMGFGLFLPDFRAAFSLGSGVAGAVSGAGFMGFSLALLASYALTARIGPAAAVLTGLALAACGMALVALAHGVGTLALGVVLAMSSAGFAWTPFNLLAHRHIGDGSRPTALSLVSTGTSLGVAAAGSVALLLGAAGLSWRIAWAGFSGAAVLAGLICHVALRALPPLSDDAPALPLGALKRRSALPLLAIALSFGASTSVFISFAVDRVASAGGLGGLPGGEVAPVVFVIYGFFGLAGLATGYVRQRVGLRPLVRGLLVISALSHLLIALSPTTWGGVAVAAAAQGVFVMAMGAVMSFWSERLFPSAPALGFTVVLLAVGVGSVLAPPLAGAALDPLGAGAVFASVAALSLASLGLTLSPHMR